MHLDAIIRKIAGNARVERALHMRYAGVFFGAGHRHAGLHHLDLLEHGRTTVKLDGRCYELRAGQALFVRAGRTHASVEPTPAPVFDLFTVSFRLSGLPEWPPVMPVVFRGEILEVFQSMIREFTGDRPGRQSLLNTHLATLFAWLWRGRSATVHPSPLTAPPADMPGDDRRAKIRRAVDFIHANYMKKIHAADIAAAAGVSPSFLTHNFRRTTGLAPGAYLIRLRFEKALWLMSRTPHKLDVIAEMTGFSDAHYFHRLFRKNYKMSPRKYLAGYYRAG